MRLPTGVSGQYIDTIIRYNHGAFKKWIIDPENNHHWWKYHCTAHRPLDWFGFNQTSKTVVNSTLA